MYIHHPVLKPGRNFPKAKPAALHNKLDLGGNQHQVAEWDEAFHHQLVAATGNVEMVRVHQAVTERIRIVRRLDFTYQNRIDVTYAEHGQILQAMLDRRQDEAVRLLRAHIQSSQTEVRHITLHQVQQARAAGRLEGASGRMSLS